MAGHHPQAWVQVAAQPLGRTTGRVRVREPVEPETAHPPPVAPLAGNRVGGRGGREGRVERRVEARDLRGVREERRDRVDGRKGRWLVKWREGRQGPDLVDHVGIQDDRRGEPRPAVDHAMPEASDDPKPAMPPPSPPVPASPPGRSADSTTEPARSTTRSLRLLDPALTTRT